MLRLLLLFLIPGIIILTMVFEIQTNIEEKRANTDAEGIIEFMKEQCARYEKAYIQTGAESEFSIESIFNGYKIEREGIVVLSDGKREYNCRVYTTLMIFFQITIGELPMVI